MDLRKGDVVIVALQGDHGKPRPVVIVQSNLTLGRSASVVVLPLTSEKPPPNLHRVELKPTASNGLNAVSYTMTERLTSAPRGKISRSVGAIDEEVMIEIDHSLRLWLGLI